VAVRIDLGDLGGLVADGVDGRAVGGDDHAGGGGADRDRGDDLAPVGVDDEDGVGGLAGDEYFAVVGQDGERARLDGGVVAAVGGDDGYGRERDLDGERAAVRVDDAD